MRAVQTQRLGVWAPARLSVSRKSEAKGSKHATSDQSYALRAHAARVMTECRSIMTITGRAGHAWTSLPSQYRREFTTVHFHYRSLPHLYVTCDAPVPLYEIELVELS